MLLVLLATLFPVEKILSWFNLGFVYLFSGKMKIMGWKSSRSTRILGVKTEVNIWGLVLRSLYTPRSVR